MGEVCGNSLSTFVLAVGSTRVTGSHVDQAAVLLNTYLYAIICQASWMASVTLRRGRERRQKDTQYHRIEAPGRLEDKADGTNKDAPLVILCYH